MNRTEHEEIQLLTRVVDHFSQAMKIKLIECAKNGKTGWDGEHPEKDLLRQITLDSESMYSETPIYKKPQKAVDIANRAMMIWYRNYGYDLMRGD